MATGTCTAFSLRHVTPGSLSFCSLLWSLSCLLWGFLKICFSREQESQSLPLCFLSYPTPEKGVAWPHWQTVSHKSVWARWFIIYCPLYPTKYFYITPVTCWSDSEIHFLILTQIFIQGLSHIKKIFKTDASKLRKSLSSALGIWFVLLDFDFSLIENNVAEESVAVGLPLASALLLEANSFWI